MKSGPQVASPPSHFELEKASRARDVRAPAPSANGAHKTSAVDSVRLTSPTRGAWITPTCSNRARSAIVAARPHVEEPVVQRQNAELSSPPAPRRSPSLPGRGMCGQS